MAVVQATLGTVVGQVLARKIVVVVTSTVVGASTLTAKLIATVKVAKLATVDQIGQVRMLIGQARMLIVHQT